MSEGTWPTVEVTNVCLQDLLELSTWNSRQKHDLERENIFLFILHEYEPVSKY